MKYRESESHNTGMNEERFRKSHDEYIYLPHISHLHLKQSELWILIRPIWLLGVLYFVHMNVLTYKLKIVDNTATIS